MIREGIVKLYNEAILKAAKNGHYSIVKLLLESGQVEPTGLG